jgi:hypothetical protein
MATVGDMPIFVFTQSTYAKMVGVILALQNKIKKNNKDGNRKKKLLRLCAWRLLSRREERNRPTIQKGRWSSGSGAAAAAASSAPITERGSAVAARRAPIADKGSGAAAAAAAGGAVPVSNLSLAARRPAGAAAARVVMTKVH